MTRPRATDDFAAIRARMDELGREREQARRTEPKDNLNARVRRIPIEEIARNTQSRLRGSPK
jgi:hypothetical protein